MLIRLLSNSSEVHAYKIGNEIIPYTLDDQEYREFRVFMTKYANKLERNAKKADAFFNANWEEIISAQAIWVDKDARLDCIVADSTSQKKIGLSSTSKLAKNEGMYFPYPSGMDVSFHQGGVTYPLDLIFLRDDTVAKIVANTDPESAEVWSCEDCDGVLEANGGFCAKKGVEIGDEIALWTLSKEESAIVGERKRARALAKQIIMADEEPSRYQPSYGVSLPGFDMLTEGLF